MIKYFLYIIFTLNVGVFNLFAIEYKASEILDSMIISLSPFSSKGIMEQEIIRSNKIINRSTFEYYSQKYGSDIMIKYISPESILGNAFLSINNGADIWVYFPKLNRSRKIVDHAKFEKVLGGDFTYLDLSGKGQWRDDYRIKKINSGEKKHYLLLLIPRSKLDPKFDSLKVYINKRSYYPNRVLYYKNNIKYKTLRFNELSEVQNVNTSMLLNMKNHLDSSETNIRIIDINYNITFDKYFFSKNNIISN